MAVDPILNAGLTIKADLNGSTRTAAFQNNRAQRAVRLARVRGLTNDKNALRQAQNAFRYFITAESGGLWHHDDSSLPLDTIRATKWGKDSALIVATYRRNASSVPTEPATSIAEYRLASETLDIYRRPWDGDGNPAFDESGFPDGILNFPRSDLTAPIFEPQPYQWKRAVVDIYVPTRLPYNPQQQVAPLVNTVNADTVQFGGDTFAPGTLRFRGMESRWVQDTEGSSHIITYAFRAAQGGFKHQQVTSAPDPQGGFFYDTETLPIYEMRQFTGNFPAHEW